MTEINKNHDAGNDEIKQAIWDDPALLEALAEHESHTTSRNASRWAWLGGMAACFCAGVIGWYVIQEQSFPDEMPVKVAYASPQTFSSVDAQDVKLSDGSEVAMNRGASLHFSESVRNRQAKLTKGEAYFEVARDEARPFTIETGNANIQVLGTAFNVDKSLSQTQIDVFHGKVAVSMQDGSDRVELVKGQRASVTARGITVSAFTATEPDWQAGWIDLNNVSLNDALYQLNRYSNKPVVLRHVDDNAAHISGRFKAADIAGSARLLAQMNGLAMHEYEDSIVLAKPENGK